MTLHIDTYYCDIDCTVIYIFHSYVSISIKAMFSIGEN